MELIQLIVLLIVIGVLLWAVNSFIPMDARIKQIVNTVVIIAVVLWLLFFLLSIFGIAHMRISSSPRSSLEAQSSDVALALPPAHSSTLRAHTSSDLRL